MGDVALEWRKRRIPEDPPDWSDALSGRRVLQAVEVDVDHLSERRLGGRSLMEECHRGAELLGVDLTKDLLGGAALQPDHYPGAGNEPGSE
jgi:hypothetical protein